MTRSEFLENVTDFEDLIAFCREINCDICSDVISSEDRDSEIEGDIIDSFRDEYWYDVLPYLNEIPNGYEYYRRDGRFDYVGLDDDDDFSEYFENVLAYADECGEWDDEEEQEDISPVELIGACYAVFTSACNEAAGDNAVEDVPLF